MLKPAFTGLRRSWRLLACKSGFWHIKTNLKKVLEASSISKWLLEASGTLKPAFTTLRRSWRLLASKNGC